MLRLRPRIGDYGMEFDLLGYDLGPVSAEDLEHGYALVLGSLASSPPTLLASELARLRAMTKARAEDGRDVALMAAAYAEEMAAYPADAVRWACRKWARMEKFWPAWSELQALLDRAVAERSALKKALSARQTVKNAA